jgi:Ca2+-binding RTX toxin-like protein
MKVRRFLGRGSLGVAGAAALAVGLVSPAAASTSASVANDTLTVNGSSASESLALRLAAGDSNILEVDFGDDGSAEHSFDRSSFSSIEVFLGAGNDQFRVDQVNGTFEDEALTVDGGSGNDTMNGGDGDELFYGRSGRDAVDGNRGDDTGYLGSGQDSFRWDPGDGSDIVEGDSGTDTLDFNGAAGDEVMSLTPNGSRSLFLRDVANIRMDMDNVERLDLTALDGVDTVTIDDMTGTDFRRADVDLQGPAGGGDGQPDIVTVNGTANADRIDVEAEGARVDVEGLQTETRITGSETIDQLQVNALDGNDDVDVDADVFALIGVTVDLGAGQI